MFETHRHRPDPSEVYHANEPAVAGQEETDGDEQEEDDLEDPELERADESGEVFLLLPKGRPRHEMHLELLSLHPKGRLINSKEFQIAPPKGNGKGGMVCLRCGKPGHFWRQCPDPFRQTLRGTGKTSPFGKKGKGKGKAGTKGEKYLSGWR